MTELEKSPFGKRTHKIIKGLRSFMRNERMIKVRSCSAMRAAPLLCHFVF